MPGSILVTGATGRLGRLIVRRLLDLKVPVRAFTRRPEVAASLFGPRVEIAEGHFGDRRSLNLAMTSVDRVLLLSPIGEHLVQYQTAVIETAEHHWVHRIVKISGSNWTLDPPGRSISGSAHAEVEARLDDSSLETVALRPNAWMQVSLPTHIASIEAGRPITTAHDATVGYIDARDIADVAVHQLLASEVETGPLVLTGAEAMSVRDIAGLAARIVGRPLTVIPTGPRPIPVKPLFEDLAVAEFQVLIREGLAAELTDTVSRLLGRPARTVAAYLAEHIRAVAA